MKSDLPAVLLPVRRLHPQTRRIPWEGRIQPALRAEARGKDLVFAPGTLLRGGLVPCDSMPREYGAAVDWRGPFRDTMFHDCAGCLGTANALPMAVLRFLRTRGLTAVPASVGTHTGIGNGNQTRTNMRTALGQIRRWCRGTDRLLRVPRRGTRRTEIQRPEKGML